MFCISCGSALPENATFCPVCGKKVTWEVKSEGSGLRQIRCSYCGSSNVIKIRTGQYRCEHCGTKFFTEGQKSGEEEEARDADVAVLVSEAQAYADKKDYSNIGAAYIKLGHYAEAKVQYEKGMSIIESNPMSACADDIAITYGNYALCIGKLGDKQGAKEYLSLAKEKRV